MLKETPLPTTVRPRHYQKLSERLRQFMAENHFRDGDKLPPERALAESFGVSRNSVREAIHALAERGLLESRHGDGTYVRVPDMEPLRSAILEAVDSEGHLFDEVMEYRRILEPAVAELAALRRTPEHTFFTISRESGWRIKSSRLPAINSAAYSSTGMTASWTPNSTSA